MKFVGVPQTRQQISAVSRLKFTILSGHVEEVLLLKRFFPIVDTCLSCEDMARQSSQQSPPPFPQIDIIGAVVIVWRVRGKTIRSVLCNIVCNNCAQYEAHTYEQTNSSLDYGRPAKHRWRPLLNAAKFG